MSILEDLPFSVCQAGPEKVDGVSNFFLPIYSHNPASKTPLATLYFLDTHGEIPSTTNDPDYFPITPNQVEWFQRTSQSLREERKKNGDSIATSHISLAFLHIPFPEYKDPRLFMKGGFKGEATMCPSVNTHFYDALAEEGIAAVAAGHDHVNDYCGILPPQNDTGDAQLGPWLCHGGCSGFGAYNSHGGKFYHRRMRAWEINTRTRSLKTWKRVEYAEDRVDEVVLVNGGAAVAPPLDHQEG
jgi:hypothetical protein